MTVKEGLDRQVDPLSPFLFDLVADILNSILNNARKQGYLKGVNIGNDTNIFNLHFADDTLLFLETSKENLATLQWILIGF